VTNAEADRLARELAERTGESLTETIVIALRERLERLPKPDIEARFARVMALAAEMRAMIGDDPVSADDLYDENGLPH
jgi:antitoxin VapB